MAATTPDSTSGDYDLSLPYWTMVETIMGGAAAMRDAGEAYLPKFPNETVPDYEYRCANAKFTNIYADIISSLASKPFAEQASLDDGADERFAALAQDIDGRGNSLHVFAAGAFEDGINYAVDWIFVDYTKARPNPNGRPLSIEEERAQGLRPYWVRIPAKRLLAVYSDIVGGAEVIVHARIQENATARNGYGEVSVERVRVLNREPIFEVVDGVETGRVVDYAPATFELWEKATNAKSGKSSWVQVDGGSISIGVIALVPFITGKRVGGSWRFIPPMQHAAYLQVEHFQQETALKSIKELTAFPMLTGNGVSLEAGAVVPVGPRAVLTSPPYGETGSHGEWAFIEPSSESLRFLAEDIANTEAQLRELGRQPLTATAGITVVTATLASQKASSAVQAWALALKDALEQAFVFTAMWLNIPKEAAPSVKIHTDFAVDLQDEKAPAALISLRKSGPNGTPDIDQRTLWAELQRRNLLSAAFDADATELALAIEAEGLVPEMPTDPATGDVIEPAAA